MRRIWATLLVVVFSFVLTGPDAFAGRADRESPPCCRSNGKHHCVFAQTQEDSSGPAFQVGRCPLFSGGQTMPPLPTAAIVKLSPAFFRAVLSHPTPRPPTEALRPVAFDRSAPNR